MIGRTLRAVTDLKALGERTVWVDCDVIQADGGTRTASVTGAFVALALALSGWWRREFCAVPLIDSLAATSVGIVGDELLLDLAYEEDSRAQVDMNVVMTGGGRFVEVQASAEGRSYTNRELQGLLDLATGGIRHLTRQAAGTAAYEIQWPRADKRDMRGRVSLVKFSSRLPIRESCANIASLRAARRSSNSNCSRISASFPHLKNLRRLSRKIAPEKRCTTANSLPKRCSPTIRPGGAGSRRRSGRLFRALRRAAARPTRIASANCCEEMAAKRAKTARAFRLRDNHCAQGHALAIFSDLAEGLITKSPAARRIRL